jgi:hypothetical protein
MSIPSRINQATETALEDQEFSRDEIDRLSHLREMYPYIEYTDSRRQWHRLRFVKWLYSQGQIKK